MFNNALTKVISHYCIFTEALPSLIHRGFRLLSSLPRLRFSSHRGEFAAITFGKDEVLQRAVLYMQRLRNFCRLGYESRILVSLRVLTKKHHHF